jgi:hypothetical protein
MPVSHFEMMSRCIFGATDLCFLYFFTDYIFPAFTKICYTLTLETVFMVGLLAIEFFVNKF